MAPRRSKSGVSSCSPTTQSDDKEKISSVKTDAQCRSLQNISSNGKTTPGIIKTFTLYQRKPSTFEDNRVKKRRFYGPRLSSGQSQEDGTSSRTTTTTTMTMMSFTAITTPTVPNRLSSPTLSSFPPSPSPPSIQSTPSRFFVPHHPGTSATTALTTPTTATTPTSASAASLSTRLRYMARDCTFSPLPASSPSVPRPLRPRAHMTRSFSTSPLSSSARRWALSRREQHSRRTAIATPANTPGRPSSTSTRAMAPLENAGKTASSRPIMGHNVTSEAGDGERSYCTDRWHGEGELERLEADIMALLLGRVDGVSDGCWGNNHTTGRNNPPLPPLVCGDEDDVQMLALMGEEEDDGDGHSGRDSRGDDYDNSSDRIVDWQNPRCRYLLRQCAGPPPRMPPSLPPPPP